MNCKKDAEWAFTLEAQKQLKNDFDMRLKEGDLLSLKEKILSLQEDERFHHTAESRKLSIALDILKMESAKGDSAFFSGLDSFDALMERYLLTTFALRRIELELESELYDDAARFLQNIPLSAYAAHVFFQNENFENVLRFYWNLYQIMKDIWSAAEKIFFLELMHKKTSTTQSLLALATHYMELKDFKRTYALLESIPAPSAEIVSLKDFVKGLIAGGQS